MYKIYSNYYGQMTTANTASEAHQKAMNHLSTHLSKADQQDAEITVIGGGVKYTIAKA